MQLGDGTSLMLSNNLPSESDVRLFQETLTSLRVAERSRALTMAVIYTKGSQVEVSFDDHEGFTDAWYAATVVEVMHNKSPKSKKRNSSKSVGICVKYETLFEGEDLSVPLTEVVDISQVRPSPPRNFDNEDAGGADLEVSDVVDAYHRDGWWKGVIFKVVVDDDDVGKKSFSVCFENPFEEFQFQRSELRRHLDWIDDSWVLAKKQEINKQRPHAVDSVAIISTPKRFQYSADKKRNREQATSSDLSHRNTHSKSSMNRNSHLSKRQTIATEQETGTPEGVTIKKKIGRPPKKSATGTPEVGKSKKKMGRPPKKLAEEPSGSSEETANVGTKKRKSRETKAADKAIDENSIDLDEQPILMWYQDVHSPIVLNTSNGEVVSGFSDRLCNDNGERVREKNPKLPFMKSSPIWSNIESLQVYQEPRPQNPHFSPLMKFEEDFREGLAIGHMVTFANVVEKTSKLQLTDPKGVIEKTLETVNALQDHGFDVESLRARLNMLLSKKDEVIELENDLENFKSDLEKCNLEKSKLDEEMRELQEKVALSLELMSKKNEEIAKLELEFNHAKLKLEKLAATPL